MTRLLWCLMAFFVTVSGAASAACPSFHTLSNGTTAHASAVMDNFNYILGCPHLGNNATPSPWSTFDATIDFGAMGAVATLSSANVVDMHNNSYYPGGSYYLRKVYGYGQFFRMGGNDFQWWQSSIGGPNSAMSITRTMHLDYSGNLTITGCLNYNSGTLGTCISDARVKRSVKPFAKAGLAEISALRPVTYSYNGLANTPDDVATGTTRDGLIAQQVQKVAPGLVSKVHRKLKPSDQATTALLEVNYGALTFGLINAVKDLKVINDNQAVKIVKLESRLRMLQQQSLEVKDMRIRLESLERKLVVHAAGTSSTIHRNTGKRGA